MLQGCAHKLRAAGMQLSSEITLQEQTKAIDLKGILHDVIELLQIGLGRDLNALDALRRLHAY